MAEESGGDRRERMFGPLKFPDGSSKSFEFYGFNQDHSVSCVLCECMFNLPSQKETFLMHLFETHKFVIADVDNIACLKSYVDYWRAQFSVKPLAYFCTTMLWNPEVGHNSQKSEYFLLSDVVPEDRILRENLQKKRLAWILDIQAKERETPISRACLFCRLHFDGQQSEYFNHLYEKHNLHLGCPENLVFTNELLDLVENKMERLQCLFCDGSFKERNVLKEHMRKKQHKRINPDNKYFDRFYIVNYLEMGKTWQQVQNEPDEVDPVDDKSDWSDWEDEAIEPQIVCLFCDEGRSNYEDILEHMNSVHDFHYKENCGSLALNFYQQVKLVNYVRLQMYELRCMYCSTAFTSKRELLLHMTDKKHIKVPDIKLWDQPEYYFPTYENDSFLCHLDDIQNDEEDELPDIGSLLDLRDVV